MEGNSNQGNQRPSKKLMTVKASKILAARAKLEDAMWEPWLRAKVRCLQRSIAVTHALTRSRRPQIGGLLLRLVMETALVKVPGKVRVHCFRPQKQQR